MTREYTEQERQAGIEAWQNYHLADEDMISRYRLVFAAGFVAGLEHSATDLAALRAEVERLRVALAKADAWVNLQGDYPGCRPAADAMLGVIRAALEGGE